MADKRLTRCLSVHGCLFTWTQRSLDLMMIIIITLLLLIMIIIIMII